MAKTLRAPQPGPLALPLSAPSEAFADSEQMHELYELLSARGGRCRPRRAALDQVFGQWSGE